MADSKWLDPVSNDATWTFADWTDEDLNVLFDLVWNTLRDASYERICFMMKIHSGDIPAADTFPDLSDDLNIGSLVAETPTNAERLQNAIYKVDGDKVSVIETDDIQTNGVVVSTSAPNNPTLAELLEDVLLYASEYLLSRNDLYTNPAAQTGLIPALAQYAWVKQWFEVMDYQTWYWRRLQNPSAPTGDVYSAMEKQDILIVTTYLYTTSTSVFSSCTCILDDGVNAPNDIYVANDLNETAPMSTPQEVRDYTITQLAANDDTWISNINQDLGDLEWSTFLNEQTGLVGLTTQIICSLTLKRVRFKLTDDFRAATPDKFNAPVYGNTYYTGGTSFLNQNVLTPPDPVVTTYSDFGTGKVNNDVENIELTKDGNDYYYLEIPAPDWDVEPALPIPLTNNPAGGSDAAFFQHFLLQRLGFKAGTTLASPFKLTGITPRIVQTDSGILFKPNLTDGTGFEHYTPA